MNVLLRNLEQFCSNLNCYAVIDGDSKLIVIHDADDDQILRVVDWE